MKDNDKLFSWFGKTLVILMMTILDSIVIGWALKTLWAWFVVPLFDVPTLSIAQALGLSFVVGLFTMHTDNKEKSKNDDLGPFWTAVAVFLGLTLSILFTMGLAWIVKGFL